MVGLRRGCELGRVGGGMRKAMGRLNLLRAG